MNFNSSDFSEEDVKVIKSEYGLSLAIFLVIAGAITVAIKSTFIRYVAFYAPKSRPINTFILFDQTLLLGFNMTFIPMTIISMATQETLKSLYGNSACWIYWFAMVNHNSYSILGSCGIAMYRIILTKYKARAKLSPRMLMKAIFGVEFMVYIPCVYLYYWGLLLSRRGPAMEFCHGRSTMFNEALAVYEGQSLADIDQGLKVQNLMLGVCCLFSGIEFSIYVTIFVHIINQAKELNIAQALTVDCVRSRNKGHAITLSGQAMHFLAENVLFGLLISLMNSTIAEPAVFCVFTCFASALLSMVQLAAAPEVKRFIMEPKENQSFRK